MSTIRFAEIDGRRVDITHLQTEYENRCDHCGKFLERPMVTVQVGVYVDGAADGVPQLDFHPACADQALPFLASRLYSGRGSFVGSQDGR